MRDDLKTALKDLHSRRDRGEIPRYERVVVETTGIADPVPIAYTLLAEPVLQHHYRLGNVVTVVDAVNIPAQLDRFTESVRQVALADRLVVSKLDLARPGAMEALRPRLTALNPAAPIVAADAPDLDPVDLLITDIHDRQSKSREVERWMHATHDAAVAHGGHDSHPDAITACCFTFDTVLDWDRFRSVDVDAAAPSRRSGAADEGSVERGRGPRPGADQRRPASRSPTRASGPMAGRGSTLPRGGDLERPRP